MDHAALGTAVRETGQTWAPVSCILFFVFLLVSFARMQVHDPAAESEEARELVANGRPMEALPIYDRLVRAYPLNPDLLLNLSIAEFSAERYRDAAGHALAALKLKPGLSAANLFLGASYLKLGEHSRALDPLKKAVDALPADHNARLMLAEALLGSDHFQEALAQFRRDSELLPDSPRVWYGLGQTYDALADLASRNLQTGSPDSSYWLTLAGDTYLKQRRFGSAFTAYREALARGPLVTGIHEGLAKVYRETGHTQWAGQEEASERKVSPVTGTADPSAAEYEAYRSYRELAAQAYDRLARLAPSLENHLYRAKRLDAEGRHREAVIEWREGLKLAPTDKNVRLALAQSLYDSRDYEAALTVLAGVLERNPESAAANFLYGASLVSLERPRLAIPYLEAACERNPRLQAARAALGQAFLGVGNPEQAIPYLKAAVAGDNDGSTRFQLFRAYQLTGNRQLANRALTAYHQFRISFEEQQSMEDGSSITAPSN